MSGAGKPRPESGLELYAWIFMRVSGLALLFLALGHLLVMHIIHNVDHIDFQFVAARYATPFWRTYDLLMLWFAMIHGVNGAPHGAGGLHQCARLAGGLAGVALRVGICSADAGIACHFDVSSAM